MGSACRWFATNTSSAEDTYLTERRRWPKEATSVSQMSVRHEKLLLRAAKKQKAEATSTGHAMRRVNLLGAKSVQGLLSEEAPPPARPFDRVHRLSDGLCRCVRSTGVSDIGTLDGRHNGTSARLTERVSASP